MSQQGQQDWQERYAPTQRPQGQVLHDKQGHSHLLLRVRCPGEGGLPVSMPKRRAHVCHKSLQPHSMAMCTTQSSKEELILGAPYGTIGPLSCIRGARFFEVLAGAGGLPSTRLES